ncbi:MAG: sodium:solute symporter family protein [Myxococcota bacterium]
MVQNDSAFQPLNGLDWAVLASIVAATLLVVICSKLRCKVAASGLSSREQFADYLLMGRRLTLPLFTATLVATWYGNIFGVTQSAFQHGICVFVTQGIFWYLAYLVFACFIVNRLDSTHAMSLPDIVRQFAGKASGRLASMFIFFDVLPVVYTISLGFLLSVFTGWPLAICMAAGTLFVCIYCALGGGFAAVVLSDAVQCIVMCIAVLVVVLFSCMHVGPPWVLLHKLPKSHLTILGNHSLSEAVVFGAIALSTLVDPNFYQRCLATRNKQVARRGILLSMVIWCGFDICTTLGGLYALAVLPHAQAGQAYLVYALQILPTGLRGFFVAGILCCILSTLDSCLFTASSTLTYDLGPQACRFRTDISRIAIFVVGILSVCIGLAFDGCIRAVWKTFGSYSAACLLPAVLASYIRPKQISDRSFIVGCCLGVLTMTLWRAFPYYNPWAQLDNFYAGVVATSVGLLTDSIFSSPTKHPTTGM